METPAPGMGTGAVRQNDRTKIGHPICSRPRHHAQQLYDSAGLALRSDRHRIVVPDAPRRATPSWHRLAVDRWTEHRP
jgi:hypothetical protein